MSPPLARAVLPGTLRVTVDFHVDDLCNNMLLILLSSNVGVEVLLVDHASVSDEHLFEVRVRPQFWCNVHVALRSVLFAACVIFLH